MLARQVDNLKDLIGKAEQRARQRGPGRPPGRSGDRGQSQGRSGRFGGIKRPRPAGAGGCFCLGTGPSAASGQRRPNSRIWGLGPAQVEPKRGIVHRDPAGRPGHRTLRWLGGLCGGLPQLRPTLDPQCRRRISCAARRDGTDIRRSRPVRADRGARGSHGQRSCRRRGPWRQSPADRCSTSSSERTVPPSIPAHGGRQAKAKRFADDAQDNSWFFSEQLRARP